MGQGVVEDLIRVIMMIDGEEKKRGKRKTRGRAWYEGNFSTESTKAHLHTQKNETIQAVID